MSKLNQSKKKKDGLTTPYSNSKPKFSRTRDSSIEARRDHIASGNYANNTERVYNALTILGEGTRKMLAFTSGLEPGHICEYVKCLLKAGRIIELEEKRPCKVSGIRAYYLTINQGQYEEGLDG